MRRRAGLPPLLALLAAAGCARPPAPSPAADEVIATASDPEERQGLTQARDDLDARRRAELDAKRKEIARLKAENRRLQEQLDRASAPAP